MATNTWLTKQSSVDLHVFLNKHIKIQDRRGVKENEIKQDMFWQMERSVPCFLWKNLEDGLVRHFGEASKVMSMQKSISLYFKREHGPKTQTKISFDATNHELVRQSFREN